MGRNYSKKAKTIVFLTRVFVALVLFMLTGLILIQQEINMKRTLSVQKIQKQIDKIQNENKNIMIKLSRHDRLENIEKVAENKLNMKYPDEVIFLEAK